MQDNFMPDNTCTSQKITKKVKKHVPSIFTFPYITSSNKIIVCHQINTFTLLQQQQITSSCLVQDYFCFECLLSNFPWVRQGNLL